MNKDISIGDKVKWKTSEGVFTGEILHMYEEEVFHEFEGRRDSRIGSRNDRALLIKGDHNNGEMLRLESEIEKADK